MSSVLRQAVPLWCAVAALELALYVVLRLYVAFLRVLRRLITGGSNRAKI